MSAAPVIFRTASSSTLPYCCVKGDILGLADYEQNFIELSALAEACLQYALEAVARAQKLKTPALVIVGLGKLGGRELNYGSDLDILFVASDKAKKQLPKLQKLAAGIMDMLSSQTELGTAFETDARLRPDGEKGLLVNTLAAYEEYYRNRRTGSPPPSR